MSDPSPNRLIAIVLYPGCAPLDVATPLHYLARAGSPYRVTTVAARQRPVLGLGPLRLLAERTFEEMPAPAVLVVPGAGAAAVAALADRELLGYLHGAAAHCELVAAIGTGSLLLAAAGPLRGRAATTAFPHRAMLGDLGAIYAARDLVEDGPAITAADSAAAMKLVLAIAGRLPATSLSQGADQ